VQWAGLGGQQVQQKRQKEAGIAAPRRADLH
jgi:hypothetical protein